MLAGDARVSTAGHSLAPQKGAFAAAGCGRVFQDVLTGSRGDRPGLRGAPGYVRAGDGLAFWIPDRLGRYLPHLIQAVRPRRDKGVRCSGPTPNGAASADPVDRSDARVVHVPGGPTRSVPTLLP